MNYCLLNYKLIGLVNNSFVFLSQKAENDASREPVQSHVTQPLRKQTVRFLSVELNIYQGDITQAQTEAVINPTNKDLDQEGQVTTALIRIDPSLSNEMVKLKTSFKRFGQFLQKNWLKSKKLIFQIFTILK